MQVSMATQRAVTTQYCHTDKSVETLTNPNTCQGHMMKTRKGGGGSGSKKRHSTTGGKQQTKTLLECKLYKGPYNKARKFLPLRMAVVKRH